MEPYSLPIQIISGNIAGWAAISAGQPFDLLKTKFQLNEHVCYNSLKQMVLRDGVTILYRGASSIYFFSGVIFAIQFSTFETVNHFMQKYNFLQQKENHIKQLMLTGAIVGMISSFIYTPTQYTKLHTQMAKEQKPQGSFSRIIQLLKNQKTQGLRKLYTGHKWTLLRDVPGLSLFYGGFHSLLYELCPKRQQATLSQQLFASSTVALAFSALTYPFDTIKTNFQLKKAHFNDLINNKIWKQKSFIRGYKVSMVRGFIMDTTALTIYENVRNLLYKKKNF